MLNNIACRDSNREKRPTSVDRRSPSRDHTAVAELRSRRQMISKCVVVNVKHLVPGCRYMCWRIYCIKTTQWPMVRTVRNDYTVTGQRSHCRWIMWLSKQEVVFPIIAGIKTWLPPYPPAWSLYQSYPFHTAAPTGSSDVLVTSVVGFFQGMLGIFFSAKSAVLIEDVPFTEEDIRNE